MAISTDDLKDQLARLPVEQRAELARYLIDSLEAGIGPDTEPAWSEELARRAQDFESGRELGIPADQVFAELRARFP